MAGFADVTRLALQPSVLALDPAFARAQFMRDITNTQRLHQSQGAREDLDARQAYDARIRELHSGQHGFGFLAPGAENDTRWNPRFRAPSSNPNQYMIDAILRDNAIAEYDRNAPRLRELDRELGT